MAALGQGQRGRRPRRVRPGILANLTRNWLRRQGRARRGLRLLGLGPDRSPAPDVPAVLDVRTALRRLPYRRRAPAPSSAVPAPTSEAAPSPSKRAASSPPPPSSPATSSAPPSPVRGHPGDTQVVKGSLSSTSAIVAGTGSTVTVTAQADLTEFDLVIRVPGTPGLTVAGGSATHEAITSAVSRKDGAVLFRFTLRPGATIAAGTYTFTARYGGPQRDAGDDTYEAYARSVERKRIHIYGNFVPKD